MLMINNHFARFQLPGKLLKTKKMCSLFPWQHGISYLFIQCVSPFHSFESFKSFTFTDAVRISSYSIFFTICSKVNYDFKV
jgi:hypothetical protein